VPNVLAFLSYVALTNFTPGPLNIMSMSQASQHGFGDSSRFRLGGTLGNFAVIALVLAFTVELYGLVPAIMPVMRVLGAAYILWLAWKTATSKPHDGASSAQNTFRSGLLLQFLNVKLILFAVTIAAIFIVPHYHSVPILAGFAAGLAAVCLAASTCWALFGALLQRYIVEHHRVVNCVMGGLLVYCAVSLFL
jgi:threonine/homoserine/homoserine lactone efflux protein